MDPLLHTQQSQSSILLRFFHVEPCTCIVHHRLNLVPYTGQFNCELEDVAVLYGVRKGFLCDSEKTQRGFFRDMPGNITFRGQC
jgi:hypothetical protein